MLTVIAIATIATGTGTLSHLHRAFAWIAALLLVLAGILLLSHVVPE